MNYVQKRKKEKKIRHGFKHIFFGIPTTSKDLYFQMGMSNKQTLDNESISK